MNDEQKAVLKRAVETMLSIRVLVKNSRRFRHLMQGNDREQFVLHLNSAIDCFNRATWEIEEFGYVNGIEVDDERSQLAKPASEIEITGIANPDGTSTSVGCVDP